MQSFLSGIVQFIFREVTTMPTFKTIRQTAAAGLMTEHYLRLLVSQGKCPGLSSGNRFLVNVEALAEQLDAESRQQAKAVTA